ncbi:ABC transporter substrate-binding protein [Butyrivibrio sp. AD3002]|uniref:ABC transporter substrate-binding protein n=1 Tax=Butyrivibrio sp. AD3002 TaxID=1280670 RepID=UPI0003B37609|nr:ABC transporter substrate-binding protein [Butyrivibrio sp. AD3002]
MKKKYMWIFLFIAILVLSGCGKSESADKTLHLALNAEIVTMDAHKTTNDYIVPMNVFDTLFAMKKNDDGSTEIVNSLVDKYDISEDGLTYHFTLKDDIVFSDGTPMTSHDVKFTFERILTLPDSAQTDCAIIIDGAQDLLDGKEHSLRGITIEDEKNFSIKLLSPFAGFTALLSTPSTVIYSEKLVAEAGEDFGVVPEKTIGSGPYIIKEWNRGSGLVFEYNPKYWGPEPSAKRVEMKIMEPQVMNLAFQKGDLDVLDCMYLDSAIVKSTYKTDTYKDKIVSTDRIGQNFLMLNENIEPLGNVQVRKAICQAIDRESILNTIYDGDGKLEDGIFTTGCIGHSDNNQGWLKYDPEAAKKLLADAGYADGFDMDLYLDSTANDSVKNTIQAIAENLNSIGIHANINTMDHASYLDLRNSGEMSAYFALWLLDFNDPDNIIYTFFGSKDNTKLRSNNYSDESVIERVAAAKTIVDENERLKEYEALEKKLSQDDAAFVPLFSLKHLFVVSDRIESFSPHWAGWNDIYFDKVTMK